MRFQRRDIWDLTLDELGEPDSVEESESESRSKKLRKKFAPRGIGISDTTSNSESESEAHSYSRRGIRQVEDEFNTSSEVIFVDDAHYVQSKEILRRLSENLKNANNRGIKVVVAFIPHRSEDILLANNDLRGRVTGLKFGEWSEEELKKIAKLGFDDLGYEVPFDVLEVLANESVQSPQLMQKLCLEVAVLRMRGQFEDLKEMSPECLKKIFRDVAEGLDMQKSYRKISGNFSSPGKPRNRFEFKDGSTGDGYDALVRTIADNPPKISIELTEIKERMKETCKERISSEDDRNYPENITQKIKQADEWVGDLPHNPYIFNYDTDTKKVEISDPYLVFYLRWSSDTDFEPPLMHKM